MKKPVKPQRKQYWAGDSKENDEKRYTYGLKQYADNAEKYIEYLEKVNGVETSAAAALNLADVMAMLPTAMINRVEVIDEKGRCYVNWKPTNRIELQVQDNGKTLKVFVS